MIAMAMLGLTLVNAGGWRDDFDSAQLAARWQFLHPVNGPTFSLTERPGWLRINIPARKGGYNHWLPGNGGLGMDAPMLEAKAPQGDFDYETHLALHSFGPAANFHLAMVVGFSPGYVLAWGPFRSPLLGTAPNEPELWCEPTGEGGFLKVGGPARDLYLRIERRGDVYTMLYRRPNQQDWAEAGQFHALAKPKFVGFMGKTFGDESPVSFDVDYASVTEMETTPAPQRAVVKVADGPSWPLDVRRYGHFIEHMRKCIYGGFWAEKLNNRKFTGEAKDGVVEGWRGVGADSSAFSHDTAVYYVPCQSQRITLKGKPVGIEQGPIAFRGGVAQVGHLVVMSKPAGMEIKVGYWLDGKPIAPEVTVGKTSDTWQKLGFTLPAQPKNFNANFRITASGKGTVWIGAASLMPADNIDGWRKDVIDVFRAVHPPLIRWPGGNFASTYNWRDGIGERDRRPPMWNRAWGGWEWNDVGTDEFLRLCQLVGAEPYICANAGEGDAREAAEWVEYCNGSANTPMGALRAKVHPAPYNVKLWGLGNEMYGNWQAGHLDANKYGLKAARMAEAMRKVDPSIQTVLVGVDLDNWDHWNARALAEAGSRSDYLSVHYYTGININADPLVDYLHAVSDPANVETMLAKTWSLAADENGGHAIPICFDEWNITRPEVDNEPGWRGFYTLREGLFAAEIFNALNRLGPKVPLACVTQTVNVLGLIRVNSTTVAPTPSYWMLKLFRDRAGTEGLPTSYQGPVADVPSGKLNLVDSSATYDPKAGKLYVFLVNRGEEGPLEVKVDAPVDCQPAGAEIVTADSALAANDYQHPNIVHAESWDHLVSASGPRSATVTVPSHSVVALTLDAKLSR